MRGNILERFEKLVKETRKYKVLRFVGYFFIPIFIGFFILKKVNAKILQLNVEKEIILFDLEIAITNNYTTLQKIYNEIIERDTYLIYSVKNDYLSKIQEFTNDLNYIKKYSNILPESIVKLCFDLTNKTNTFQIKLNEYNNAFVNRRKIEYADLFKRENLILDEEQQTAVIVDDKHNLVVAGAGSGKTEVLITRIAYLIKRKPDGVNPQRILALAFQTKAANEIKNRLKKRYNIDIEIRTFHSFGKKVIEDYAVRKFIEIKKLNPRCEEESKYQKFIQELFELTLNNDISFQNRMVSFLKYYADNQKIKQEVDFVEKEEYYQYQKNLTYTSLDGTKVKSESERAIANFFFMHNLNGKKINFVYEELADWMTYINKDGKEYTPKPDFFFPEYDIYLEHWAINKDGNVPEWFSGEDPSKNYQENMSIKKSKYLKNNKILIETTEAEFNEGPIENILEEKFISALQEKNPDENYHLSKLSYTEIVEKVWEECKEFVKVLPMNISRFITIAKTYGLIPADIERRLTTEKWSRKQLAFAHIALKIYEVYEEALAIQYSIDFSDMINHATKFLIEDQAFYQNTYDHILIDEYQDISAQRFYLIKTLMAKNLNCKLFCVGDDWQSIMGFAGSNLDYFIHFNNYFDHPARTDLVKNYRSIKSIVNAGTAIIKNNFTNQIQKQIIAHTNKEEPILVYSSRHQEYFLEKYYEQIANHALKKIAELAKCGYKYDDIMILLRIAKNPKLRKYLRNDNRYNIPFSNELDKPGCVHILSVHKSKGLESKIVILLNVDKGLYGFPCELENPDIFEIAIKDNDGLREQEERRLFYVAVTRAKEQVIIYTQKCSESEFITEIKEFIVKQDLYY
ncbi:MAG: UvrD-helicase domain-containing protein [Candidatus Heimdallarchaeota archaeon]|nr:UvrD-helicase domain-containing protein [Candidatus Heimdallarchaeota archaeon]